MKKGWFSTARVLRLEGWEGLFAAALLFSILLTFVFPEAVLQGKVFRTPDSLAPSGLHQYVENNELEAPLWNPFIFAGMPAFASLSYHPGLYPMSALLRVIMNALSLPPLTWLLFHYVWAALGLFAFLRWRGTRPWLAWLGGALFILMPAQVAVGAYGHGSKVMTLSWIPWMLLFADRLLGRDKNPGWPSLATNTALLGASTAGLMLSAHVQVAYYGLLTLGLFGLFRLGLLLVQGHRGRAWKALAAAALALLLAAGASALLYAPVQEYGHHSIRGISQGGGADWQYATAWSLHPAEWFTFLVPSAAGFGESTYFGHMPMTNYPNYVGLLAVLAAAMLFLRGRRSRFDLFFKGLAIVTTVIAAGQYLPILYRPLYEALPYFNRFRVPVMILILQQLSVAILFARGLERVLVDQRVRADFRWALALAALVFLLLGIGAPAVLEGAARDGLAQRLSRQLAGLSPTQVSNLLADLAAQSVAWFRVESIRAALLLLLPLAVLELARRSERFPLAPALTLAALVFVLGDMLPLDHKVLHPENHWDMHRGGGLWGRELAPQDDLPPKTLGFLKETLDDQRYFALPGSPFAGNNAASQGLANLGGYHAAKMAQADSVLRAMGSGGSELLGRFSVKYLIGTQAMNLGPDFPHIRAGGDTGTTLYENKRWRSRLFTEDRVKVENPAASRGRLMEGRPAAPLHLSADPGLELSPEETPCGKVLEADYGLDRVSCSVDMARAGLLVLADMNYPGWMGRVDGQEQELLVADGFFRALALEAGQHEVAFEFRPASMETLRWIRRASFLMMILLLALGLIRREEKEALA